MTFLIKQELKLESGSKVPHKEKVGHLTIDALKRIADLKMVDLNANNMDMAMNIVAGSARSMGITTDLPK
jgi:large subunit ribosomal protein L11